MLVRPGGQRLSGELQANVPALCTVPVAARRQSILAALLPRRTDLRAHQLGAAIEGASVGGDSAKAVERRLPLLLLLLALSSLFVGIGERGLFYHKDFHHNWESAHNLAVAENLSFEHRLLMFKRLLPSGDGTLRYAAYNRFPIGAAAIIKAAMAPFDDLSAKIVAARLAMLAFFCATAWLAFDALRRICGDRWMALAATLLAFSSYFTLRWADAVDQDMGLGLFAVVLAFHGIVVHVRDGRFGQLLAKTCCALLLDWHVYGLLLAFIGLDLAYRAVRAWQAPAPAAGSRLARLGSVAGALGRSRSLRLGIVALLFGLLVVGFNFANEYAAMSESRNSIKDLPTVQALLERVAGIYRDVPAPALQERIAWWAFVSHQLRLIGLETMPTILPVVLPALLLAIVGALALVGCLVWLPFADRRGKGGRLLLATLALSAPCWTLLMRYYAGPQDFHGRFYTTIALTLFTLVLLWLDRRFGTLSARAQRRLGAYAMPGLAGIAAALFAVSSVATDRLGTVDATTLAVRKQVLAEFDGIREITRGHSVFVAYDANLASATALEVSIAQLYYLLSGSILQYDGRSRRTAEVMGAAAPAADANGTPRSPSPVATRWPGQTKLGVPPSRARAYDFIVTLTATAFPATDDLALLTPANRFARLHDGASFASINDFYLHWYRSQYAAFANHEPAQRSTFDVYLHGRDLSFLKARCSEEDVRGTFFVHVFPEDMDSLPAARREGPEGREGQEGEGQEGEGQEGEGQEKGFDALDFRFVDHGASFDGRCMASIRLPAYTIASIATGNAGGQAWRTQLAPAR